MAVKLFSIFRRRVTRHDELLDNDLQTLADAIDSLAAGSVNSVSDDGEDVVTVDNADPENPIVGFAGVNVDGSTISGDGRKSNPLVAAYQAPSVDGVTITGDGTPGNPLVAAGGGAVNYANVFFVDSTNGNNLTAAQNDFTKPYFDTNPAMNAAALLSPTATDRTLIYVRRGNYGSYINLQDNTDWYCEPGVVFTNVAVLDNAVSLNAKFMGKAVFTGYGFQTGGIIFRANGATSKVHFEFDEINTTGAAVEINDGASATIVGRKIFSETLNKGYGITVRGSGTFTIDVTEEIAAWHNVIAMRFFSGKAYVTCPRLYLHEGNTYGGNYKAVLHIYDNLGGELTVNGDLIVNNIAGYYGGTSSVITRWVDSWLTVRLNGNIFAENQFGVYGLGSSGASRTIINGDVKTNNLAAYVASNSSVVFRNGTLLNNNTTTGSEGYPVVSVGGSGSVWVENCHLHSLGLGATYPNIAAFWKDTTTATLNVYNSVHSGADTPGFFIRNSVGGQPVNNVRILNCRATKPLDTNITDILTPTGFIQDANIQSINFI